MNWPWTKKEEPAPAPPVVAEPAAAPAAAPSIPPAAGASGKSPLEEPVVAAMKKCYDPEIPVNIYDLGLIYGVEIDDAGAVQVQMTLTAPACPVAGTLPGEVERAVRSVPGVTEAKVTLVWDPPWHPGMMSKLARVMLGM